MPCYLVISIALCTSSRISGVIDVKLSVLEWLLLLIHIWPLTLLGSIACIWDLHRWYFICYSLYFHYIFYSLLLCIATAKRPFPLGKIKLDLILICLNLRLAIQCNQRLFSILIRPISLDHQLKTQRYSVMYKANDMNTKLMNN